MILIPITWKYSFLLLRCVWADTDWQIETVTVLWVKIVRCQSANQPWPICKPDILFSGQSSLPPPPVWLVFLYPPFLIACVHVCVFSSFHLFLTSPAALICSTAVMTFPETSSLVVFLVFLLFFLTIICFRLWSVCKAFKDICVYTDMCVCVWSKYPPLGSLVRRGSGKCDDHLMFCEAPSFYTYTKLFNTQTHTQIHICSVGVVQPQAERLYHCLGIVAFVSSVQRIRLSPPHFLLSFIPHLQPCHSPFLSPPHTIHTRGFFP